MLHWAAASGNMDMLAFLLERALDLNTLSYGGQTPLHVAAGRGHDACVRLLLSNNAQPDLGAHVSSLHLCAMASVLENAIKRSVVAERRFEGSLSSVCANDRSMSYEHQCEYPVACAFSAADNQVEPSEHCAVDLRGDTALHEAAGGGHEPATRTLLAGRASPNPSGPGGETPLIRAARRGHAGCVEVQTLMMYMFPCSHGSLLLLDSACCYSAALALPTGAKRCRTEGTP